LKDEISKIIEEHQIRRSFATSNKEIDNSIKKHLTKDLIDDEINEFFKKKNKKLKNSSNTKNNNTKNILTNDYEYENEVDNDSISKYSDQNDHNIDINLDIHQKYSKDIFEKIDDNKQQSNLLGIPKLSNNLSGNLSNNLPPSNHLNLNNGSNTNNTNDAKYAINANLKSKEDTIKELTNKKNCCNKQKNYKDPEELTINKEININLRTDSNNIEKEQKEQISVKVKNFTFSRMDVVKEDDLKKTAEKEKADMLKVLNSIKEEDELHRVTSRKNTLQRNKENMKKNKMIERNRKDFNEEIKKERLLIQNLLRSKNVQSYELQELKNLKDNGKVEKLSELNEGSVNNKNIMDSMNYLNNRNSYNNLKNHRNGNENVKDREIFDFHHENIKSDNDIFSKINVKDINNYSVLGKKDRYDKLNTFEDPLEKNKKIIGKTEEKFFNIFSI